MLDPDLAAAELEFPNGTVITPDGRRVMTDYPRELKNLVV